MSKQDEIKRSLRRGRRLLKVILVTCIAAAASVAAWGLTGGSHIRPLFCALTAIFGISGIVAIVIFFLEVKRYANLTKDNET